LEKTELFNKGLVKIRISVEIWLYFILRASIWTNIIFTIFNKISFDAVFRLPELLYKIADRVLLVFR